MQIEEFFADVTYKLRVLEWNVRKSIADMNTKKLIWALKMKTKENQVQIS